MPLAKLLATIDSLIPEFLFSSEINSLLSFLSSTQWNCTKFFDEHVSIDELHE